MINHLKKLLPQDVIAYLYVRKKRLVRMGSILQTAYWRLVFHDRLNFSKDLSEPPEVKVLSQNGDFEQIEVESLRLYWPREYRQSVLAGLYREVFRPASGNPHAYEAGEIRIKPGDWVVDAGACEGFFTFYALQRGANVLMIEPVPLLAAALARTFASEIHLGRVKLVQAGLGKKAEKNRLSIDPNSVLMSKIDNNGSENIDIVSLDQLVYDGTIPRIDFLKMDIEGFELAAMQGATRVLKEQMPVLSIAVYHEYDNARVLRDFIVHVQPKFQIRWRGIFLRREFGKPRPFMLFGHC